MNKKYNYFNNFKYIFLQYWKSNKRYILALLGDIPVNVIIALLSAFLPKIILDSIEKNIPTTSLMLYISITSIILIFLKISEKGFSVYQENCLVISRYNLFQKTLFIKLMKMDYNNFIYNETRLLKEKANRAVNGVTYGVASYLLINKKLYSSLFGFFSFAAIIIKCNFWFIPILIGSYILSSIGWVLLQKYNNSIKDDRAKVFLQLNYVTFRSKNFSEAKDIRIYDLVDFLMSKINKHLTENTLFDIKKNNGHFVNVLFEDFLKVLVSLFAYIYLIKLQIDTDMSLGDFALYFSAITGFGIWLSKIVESISSLIESNSFVNDYRNFLSLPDKNTVKQLTTTQKDSPCSIELQNVSFSYDDRKSYVINNISLNIKPGEKIAIVGSNGAGKSTLAKLLCGLFSPTEGNILINGKSTKDYNKEDCFKLFSTVFQDTPILPTSIAKNIALCENAQIDKSKLFRCLELSGLLEIINKLPQRENTLLVPGIQSDAISLSGGEFQRLLLARALYKESPIIILDEPTSSLDPIAEKNLYLQYNQLTKNKTAFFISHRLSSTKFCDRIILIDDCKIKEIGTHNELINNGGLYAEMFEIQSKYYRGEGYFE